MIYLAAVTHDIKSNTLEATAGGVTINVRNSTAGSLSEALVLSFAIIKGTTS